MRRFLFSVTVLALSMLSYGFITGDEDPLKNLFVKLDQYRALNPQEKIHIHTDKPYYTIGDSIWFKAYVVNADSNRLSALSRILYVDLINEKDSIKKSLRIPIVSGLAWGDFVLTDSLSEGNYRLRAYTTWMRNFGEEYFFDKTFQIGNAFSNQVISDVQYTFSKIGIRENVSAAIKYKDINGKPLAGKEVSYAIQLDYRNITSGKAVTDAEGNILIKFTNAQPFVLKSGKINTTLKLEDKIVVSKSFPVKTTSAETDVQFFPEGGQLVNGIRCRVAFKAVGADGLSRNISGTVVDKENNEISQIKTEHAGMGSFAFVPGRGLDYTAIVKFEDGSEKKVALPKAVNEGYTLSVGNADPENLVIKISSSENLLQSGEVTLVAQSNGIVHYVSRNSLNNTVFAANLPKTRFPNGILQLTLFSPSYQPVAERLVFINNPDPLKISVQPDKTNYGKREKVTLGLGVQDSSGKPVSGNFSLSVINESLIPFDENRETTILSNLLLSSDLKGYVEKPNYYFLDPNDDKRRHLDILLLAQGWRRFTWKSILTNSYPKTIYQPEQSITLSGRVTNPNGSPVVGGKVTILASKGNMMILDTITDAEGKFRIEDLNFNDSTRFVVQARNARGKKNVDIELDHIPPQLVTKNKNAPDVEINVNQSILPYLRNRNDDFAEMRKNGTIRKSIMLAEVRVVEKKPVLTNSSNLNGAGNADAVIKADRLQNCVNLAQCLQGMVAGVIVQNGVAYSTRSMYSSFSRMTPMQLIVDGMYVEPDYLSIIPPMDVESIEVLKSGGNTAIYGMRGGGGVLIINTKRGERNLSYRNYAPGIATYAPQGLYYSRQFYSPSYEPALPDNSLPDLRSTIYWTPNILTDSTGKASLSFYTADAPGNYKVVVEGLGWNGALGRKVFRFSVH